MQAQRRDNFNEVKSFKETADVPNNNVAEPDLVIGFLTVGLAGLLPKKQINKAV
ncbi:hypothetical protein [Dapis sp. BLCC M229]|uniref:hypothetical protein n=1 Tax=Dapis sp. BLCC M229 TaxID=3400188 RepID=UPI003CE721A6